MIGNKQVDSAGKSLRYLQSFGCAVCFQDPVVLADQTIHYYVPDYGLILNNQDRQCSPRLRYGHGSASSNRRTRVSKASGVNGFGRNSGCLENPGILWSRSRLKWDTSSVLTLRSDASTCSVCRRLTGRALSCLVVPC